MGVYLLISAWPCLSGKKSQIFLKTWSLFETCNSAVHQALGSDGSRRELLLHCSTLRHFHHDPGHYYLQNFHHFHHFNSFLHGWDKYSFEIRIDLTLWENYPLSSEWEILQKKQGGKIRPSDIFTFKSFFDGVAVVFKKREHGLRWMPKTFFLFFVKLTNELE